MYVRNSTSTSFLQVMKPTILQHAEPVLTPMERLRRHDRLIVESLAEKHRILARLLSATTSEDEQATGPGDEKASAEEKQLLDQESEKFLNRMVDMLAAMEVRPDSATQRT